MKTKNSMNLQVLVLSNMQSKIAQLYKTIELLRLPLAEPFQLQQTGLFKW